MTAQLIYPYTYETRTPIFHDRVLFVPEYYSEEDNLIHRNFINHELATLLLHPRIQVEFCSGNGQWIAEMAKANPDILWIACECRYDRVNKIFKRMKAEKIPNLLIAFGYAEVFAKYYLENRSVEKIYINFPDPWPKKRHAKHRLFQVDFLNDLKNIMKPKGKLTLVTDDFNYLEESIIALKEQDFVPVLTDPFYIALDDTYGFSFFQDLWIKKGRQNFKTEFTLA